MNNSSTPHQQDSTPDMLILFGTGVDKKYIHGMSVRTIRLLEGQQPDQMTGAPSSTGRYAVMVDDTRVSGFLPPAQAEAALDETAARVNRLLWSV